MIHLDHAATSFPKPPAVLAAVRRWFESVGVSADRGDGANCVLAARTVAATRERLGALCGVPPARIAFVSGATEGLNLVLRALLAPGDRVLTTAFEHSSVVRPLVALQRERGLQLEVLPPDAARDLPAAPFAAALQRWRPRVCVFAHASNVTGTALDAAVICAAARDVGCTTVLDASQTAGLLDLRVGADVVVASGHKALHGPPGIGFVAAQPRVPLPPQKQGGTGSSRALDEHPTEWPQAFEAGTPNTPAIFGLGAALEWLAEQTPARLLARGLGHVDALAAGLAGKPGVRLLLPPPERRVPVLSFVHDTLDPSELGALFAAASVQVRSGFHCAPWLHAHLGTAAAGTVRLSPGPELTPADLATALAAF
ncbi:MAG: aminotransferase class V-fold PLP-dependent enzyme [Planctomycetes bacterium]|nr:aminotransferase class V-fold PLP-dependent enzyme [Planctomycetota bacterium]